MDFARTMQAKAREQSGDQKFYRDELWTLESHQANYVRAIGEGQALGTLLPALEEIERKIAAVKAKIEATRPRPVPMPDDLPARYRAHIEELAATLSADEIVERAAEWFTG